jgi:hypothetical protein
MAQQQRWHIDTMDGPFVLADATHVAPPLRTLCTPLFEAAVDP